MTEATRLGRGRSLPDLVRAGVSGEDVALGRLLSCVEDGGAEMTEVLRLLPPSHGTAHVVGVTGPPGAGKSTLTSALVAQLRECGARVAILAVDPSSARSGGALLGDRIRMQCHDLDPAVVVRSLSSRGHLGGLSAAVPLAAHVLEAAGFDTVIVETVGVGQSEMSVAALADTVVVVLAPGMGDGVQAEKAGLFEEADVFVVNKAERTGAIDLTRDLRSMLRLRRAEDGQWAPPIVQTTATSGSGLPELLDGVDDHLRWAQGCGIRQGFVRCRVMEVIHAVVAVERLRSWANRDRQTDLTVELADQVLSGDVDMVAAAARLV